MDDVDDRRRGVVWDDAPVVAKALAGIVDTDGADLCTVHEGVCVLVAGAALGVAIDDGLGDSVNGASVGEGPYLPRLLGGDERLDRLLLGGGEGEGRECKGEEGGAGDVAHGDLSGCGVRSIAGVGARSHI
jgi:hypothetical protein